MAGSARCPDPETPILPDSLRIPVGPGSIHVDRYGYAGSPIVLLHGFPTSAFLWRDVGVRLARLRHRAYAPDLFGYGESDRPFDAAFGVAAQADYVDRALTSLRVARTTVVGVDLGSLVALRLAASRPERVSRLVVINPPSLRRIPGRDVALLQKLSMRFVVRVSRSVTGAAPLLEPILKRSVVDPEIWMPPRLIARYLAPFVGRDGVAHLYALTRSIRRADIDQIALERISAPTLVVRSQHDEWVDHEVSEQLAEAIPYARQVRVAGAGRLLPEEQPDYVARLIHAFDTDQELPVSGTAPDPESDSSATGVTAI